MLQNLLFVRITSTKLNATIRSIGELADYNFNIRYRPGKHADTLSRMSLDMEACVKSCTEETTQQVLQATISGVHG